MPPFLLLKNSPSFLRASRLSGKDSLNQKSKFENRSPFLTPYIQLSGHSLPQQGGKWEPGPLPLNGFLRAASDNSGMMRSTLSEERRFETEIKGSSYGDGGGPVLVMWLVIDVPALRHNGITDIEETHGGETLNVTIAESHVPSPAVALLHRSDRRWKRPVRHRHSI